MSSFTEDDLQKILTELKAYNDNLRVSKCSQLRSWQKIALIRAMEKHINFISQDRDTLDQNEINKIRTFIVTAFPGSGKTMFAFLWFLIARKKGWVDSMMIIAPTRQICDDWIEKASEEWGLELMGKKPSEVMNSLNGEFNGRVITYQKLFTFAKRTDAKNAFKKEVKDSKIMLVLDEAHHSSEVSDWGNSLQDIFSKCEAVVLLTGTPYRTDNQPMPFVHVHTDESGSYTFTPDVSYTYGEGVREGALRRLRCCDEDGLITWQEGESVYQHKFEDKIGITKQKKRLRAATTPFPENHENLFCSQIVLNGINKLKELRARPGYQYAQGLVYCENADRCKEVEQLFSDHDSTIPVDIVLSETNGRNIIKDFKKRPISKHWLISVRMMGEGVDIPNICVIVYISNVATITFLYQATGRSLRMSTTMPDLKECYFLVPKDQRLINVLHGMMKEEQSVKVEYCKDEELDDIDTSGGERSDAKKIDAINLCEHKDIADEDKMMVPLSSWHLGTSTYVQEDEFNESINMSIWKEAEKYIENSMKLGISLPQNVTVLNVYHKMMEKSPIVETEQQQKAIASTRPVQTLEEKKNHLRKDAKAYVSMMVAKYQNLKFGMVWTCIHRSVGLNKTKMEEYTYEQLKLIKPIAEQVCNTLK